MQDIEKDPAGVMQQADHDLAAELCGKTRRRDVNGE